MRTLTLVYRNLSRRKARAIISSIGLILAIAVIISTFTVSAAMQTQVGNEIDKYGPNIVVTPNTQSINVAYGSAVVGNVTIPENATDKIFTISNKININVLSPTLYSQMQYRNSSILVVGVFLDKEAILIVLAMIAVVVVGASYGLSSQLGQPAQQGQSPQGYPQNVAPIFYTSSVITANGTKVDIPASFVNSTNMAFVDLKLETPTNTLTYKNRSVPLSSYKNGDYLPLIIVQAPSGKITAGVRVCEPCGSFSFHIVQGKLLQCDVCGTQWNLEDFSGVSGGCVAYPPPNLTASISDNIQVDLSALQMPVVA